MLKAHHRLKSRSIWINEFRVRQLTTFRHTVTGLATFLATERVGSTVVNGNTRTSGLEVYKHLFIHFSRLSAQERGGLRIVRIDSRKKYSFRHSPRCGTVLPLSLGQSCGASASFWFDCVERQMVSKGDGSCRSQSELLPLQS
jgi:hypothetical protein